MRDTDALFCYECGKPLSSKAKKSEPAEAGEVSRGPAAPDESQPAQTAEVVGVETINDVDKDPSATEQVMASADKPLAEEAGAETIADVTPDLPTTEPVVASADKPELSKSESSLKPDESTAAQPAARRGDKTRERLHRASEVARGVTRGVIEEPAKRVEKIRHVSNVVIEEASYDPSLRFVLVALALFVVFIVLLVLSKVMG